MKNLRWLFLTTDFRALWVWCLSHLFMIQKFRKDSAGFGNIFLVIAYISSHIKCFWFHQQALSRSKSQNFLFMNPNGYGMALMSCNRHMTIKTYKLQIKVILKQFLTFLGFSKISWYGLTDSYWDHAALKRLNFSL